MIQIAERDAILAWLQAQAEDAPLFEVVRALPSDQVVPMVFGLMLVALQATPAIGYLPPPWEDTQTGTFPRPQRLTVRQVLWLLDQEDD